MATVPMFLQQSRHRFVDKGYDSARERKGIERGGSILPAINGIGERRRTVGIQGET